MPAKVTLHVTNGALETQQHTFVERTTCIVGRSADCDPTVPDDETYRAISRHHCLFDINPPDVRVRDIGSLAGTYVNGYSIGMREAHMSPEEGAELQLPEHDLRDGDEVTLGQGEVAFRVSMFAPVSCDDCSVEIEGLNALDAVAGASVVCKACQKKKKLARRPKKPAQKPIVCAQCGKNAILEAKGHRQGAYLCAACKDEPSNLVQHLLQSAKHEDEDMPNLDGYDIIKEINRGGQGIVYLARDKKTNDLLALKLMLPIGFVSDRAKEDFLRETRNTEALKHPNIVEVRSSGCIKGIFFLALEYCDGGSVDDLMQKRGGRLTIDEAGPIILQALAGLEYAHNAIIPNVKLADGSIAQGRGLVHRDIKPLNIFLVSHNSSYIAKNGDYGLSKAFDLAGLSGQTQTGSAAGSPWFTPRQQLINFKYAKPEIDVWAMAASFYNMITGQSPRDFPSGIDPWKVVLTQNAVPIRRRDSSIPADLAEVLDAALVDKPEIGFKSAAEFRRTLERVL